MADAITYRWEDWYRYDVVNDRQVVRLLAITGTGTYSAELGYSGAADLREKRKTFREYVLDCMAKDIGPHEIEMEDDPAIVRDYA